MMGERRGFRGEGFGDFGSVELRTICPKLGGTRPLAIWKRGPRRRAEGTGSSPRRSDDCRRLPPSAAGPFAKADGGGRKGEGNDQAREEAGLSGLPPSAFRRPPYFRSPLRRSAATWHVVVSPYHGTWCGVVERRSGDRGAARRADRGGRPGESPRDSRAITCPVLRMVRKPAAFHRRPSRGRPGGV